jgi:hypothetical protein
MVSVMKNKTKGLLATSVLQYLFKNRRDREGGHLVLKAADTHELYNNQPQMDALISLCAVENNKSKRSTFFLALHPNH